MKQFVNIRSEHDGRLSLMVTRRPTGNVGHDYVFFIILLDGGLEANDIQLSYGQLACCMTALDIKYVIDMESRGIGVSVPRGLIRGIAVPDESSVITLKENDLAMLDKYYKLLMDERQGRDLDDSTVSLIKALLVRLARILE